MVLQARRQEFPEGGLQRLAHLAEQGAIKAGAAQGPQKLWDIWCKILQSSNFQALHLNFRKFCFLHRIFIIFIKFYNHLG